MYWPRNYRHNITIPVPQGYLNGQSAGPISKMHYGISTMAKAGCGTLAVYNSLVALGKTEPLPRVIQELELYAEAFLGMRGTFAFMLPIFFRRRGIKCSLTFSYKKVFESKYSIVSYWTKRPLFSGGHVVFVEKKDDGFLVYNRYSNRSVPYHYDKPKAFLRRSCFMMGIVFSEV